MYNRGESKRSKKEAARSLLDTVQKDPAAARMNLTIVMRFARSVSSADEAKKQQLFHQSNLPKILSGSRRVVQYSASASALQKWMEKREDGELQRQRAKPDLLRSGTGARRADVGGQKDAWSSCLLRHKRRMHARLIKGVDRKHGL